MLQNIQNAIVGVSKKQYLCTRNQNNTIFFVPKKKQTNTLEKSRRDDGFFCFCQVCQIVILLK